MSPVITVNTTHSQICSFTILTYKITTLCLLHSLLQQLGGIRGVRVVELEEVCDCSNRLPTKVRDFFLITAFTMFSGSCEVQATVVDNWAGKSFCVSSDMSLHSWVQQGDSVTLVTEARTHLSSWNYSKL